MTLHPVNLAEAICALLSTLIGVGLSSYFIWDGRNTHRNYIKLAYFGVALYTGITNLANITLWIVTVSSGSFVPQYLTFVDFFEFTSLRLLRSVALGATFIKLRANHSWNYTPPLLRSVFAFILLSWISVSFGYILSLSLSQASLPWHFDRLYCFFYGHTLLALFKIAVDVVYAFALALLIIVSVARSTRICPDEVMKGWSEEKIEFVVLNNRLYSIYLPCLLLLVGQELTVQCVLSFGRVQDKNSAELLDGYERVTRSLEPVVVAVLYYVLILRKVSPRLLAKPTINS
uniref:G_PROTEIN_RECEP_F1_2 domain-containing protein n=1 Tax=Steinernema glaseri TaxID=37863 RepID=A0A1I7ZD63_9BILA